jgi:tape measure domain-containing protein
MADILASVSVVLGAEVSGFKAAMADARRELKGLQQFSEGLKGAGDSLTRYLTAPLVGIGAASLVSSAKLESLRKGLEAVAQQELGKSGLTGLSAMAVAAQQTNERLKELLQVAKAPGLSFEGAEQADIRLRAVGISAEQSAKSIKAFANAIATTGGGSEEFTRVTVQLAQLSAKGKVLAQDLRPIIEAAPSVAGALQRLYGTVDSETISASLAKQGQSSKDFIRILTDELAKLPQVSGGLKAIYENDMDALLVASAKVGDGIAKAFNLQAVGEKLGNQITALGDGFANLSAPAQGAIVTFAGLTAATGPLLVGLGALGAGLPAIKAGIAAVESGAKLLSTGLVSLLNPTTLAIAGLAALAGGAYYLATANQRLLDSYREQAAATRQLTTEVSPLLDRYDELRAKTSLTTAEQAELKAIVEKVTAVLPAAGQGLDGYGNYLGLATDKARAFIQQNQGLDKAIALQSLPAQQQKLGELTQAYDRLLNERDQLSRGAFNSVKINDLGTQFLVDFRQELAATATELDKQRRLVAELGAAAGVTATEYDAIAVTLPGLAANLAKLGTAFPVANLEAFREGIAAQFGLLATLKARLKEVQDQRDKETTVGAIKVDNAEITNLQKQIAALEGTDKVGKKAADAITKLRQELARLTALDNLLGDTPSQLQVLERRAATLVTGLKGLVDAGVSPASRAFQGFAADMVKTSQAADKLLAGIGKNGPDLLDFKPAAIKGLIPTTIGDTLPQDVARLLGDYAKQAKPFELPLAVKLNMQAITEAQQPVQLLSKEFLTLGNSLPKFDGLVSKDLNKELLSLGAAFRQIDGAKQLGIEFDAAGAKAGALQGAIQNLLGAGLNSASAELKKFSADFKELAFNSQIAQELKASIMDLASGISTAFTDAISGTQGFGESIASALLSTIGDLAIKLGGIILASGLGIEALSTSLKTFTGVPAIAAGIGLLALGGIAKGAVANLGKTGISSAPISTPAIMNYGQKSNQTTIKVLAEFRLRGQDLVAQGRQQTYRSKVTD